jgi:chromate reductase
MNSVEAYIQFEDGLVSEDGEVADTSTREFLQNYMEEFHQYIARVYTVLPRNA